MVENSLLVVGGAGFIGSHLVDHLVQQGHSVHVVDDLSTGDSTYINAGAVFHQVDVRDPALDHVFAIANPKVVFHLAAHASVSESVRDPRFYADVNVLGTINVLHQCVAHQVERLVFSSTGGALYGEPERLPCDEDHPIRPLSPYGASKAAAELFIRTATSLSGLRHTILRYANVYGPRQDPFGEAGVVAIFTRAMLDGGAPTIFGDGSQQRDYVYVDDVVHANLLAAEIDGDGVFNIGTGNGTMVSEVFAELAEVSGYGGTPTYAPERSGDIGQIFLDVGRAQRELGWRPETSFKDGAARTVDSMR